MFETMFEEEEEQVRRPRTTRRKTAHFIQDSIQVRGLPAHIEAHVMRKESKGSTMFLDVYPGTSRDVMQMVTRYCKLNGIKAVVRNNRTEESNA